MPFRFTWSIAVVLSLVAATVIAAVLVFADARQEARDVAEHRADRAAQLLQTAFDDATASLDGVRGLFNASEHVTASEFEVYSDQVRESTMDTFGFIASVPSAERAEFERRTGLRILDIGPTGIRSAAARARYYPIESAASSQPGIRNALGVDLGGDPARRASLEAARDAAAPRATEPGSLFGGALATLIFEPVYTTGEPPAGLAARRDALVGFAAGVLPIEALNEMLDLHLGAQRWLQVFDGETLLSGGPGSPARAEERTVTLAGRSWRVVAEGPAASWTTSVAIVVAGLLLSALAGLLLLQAALRERYAMRLVDERLQGQRAAEAALREREARLRSVIESSSDAIVMADAEGSIIDWNPGATTIFGYAREDALGRSVTMLLPERLHGAFGPGGERITARGLADLLGRPVALTGRRADGTEFPFELSLASWVAPEGRLFSGIVRDASERAALQRMKDEFVAVASHELKTPLTAVLGYLEVVLDGDAGELTEEQRNFLGVAERNARRLVRLTGDLLLVSQGDAGRLALERQAVDLARLVRECVQSARPRAEAQGLTLRLDADPLPDTAGDRTRLAQVLDNLMSNALKFTPDGGSIQVRLRREGAEAVVEVADTGIGIAPEEQARLFERFYRTERSRSVAGTGLGLAVSKMIVDAHGGRMEVESAVGAGSTFRVRLPIAPVGTPLASPAQGLSGVEALAARTAR